MAFVNEYVSDSDIKKYQLEDLYKEWSVRVPPGFRYDWTVDRERDSFYIPMRTYREERGNETRGVLYFLGIHWDVHVSKGPSGNRSFADNPYRVVWGLIHIKHPDGSNAPYEQIVPVLKEALTAYKISGVTTPECVRNVITMFTF